jgi:hypothetical protein
VWSDWVNRQILDINSYYKGPIRAVSPLLAKGFLLIIVAEFLGGGWFMGLPRGFG